MIPRQRCEFTLVIPYTYYMNSHLHTLGFTQNDMIRKTGNLERDKSLEISIVFNFKITYLNFQSATWGFYFNHIWVDINGRSKSCLNLDVFFGKIYCCFTSWRSKLKIVYIFFFSYPFSLNVWTIFNNIVKNWSEAITYHGNFQLDSLKCRKGIRNWNKL